MMRISREFLLLIVAILIGIVVLFSGINTRSSIEQGAVNYEGQCTKLAASEWDKPLQLAHVSVHEIETDAAMDACSQALDADPSSNRLKFYLGRSYESLQTIESLLQAKKIYLELSELGYAPAFYQLFHLGVDYKQLEMSTDDMYMYLKSAADMGLPHAVNRYISVIGAEDHFYFDPVSARQYEKRAIAAENLELIFEKPELFFEKLDEWQVCYATILAPTGLSLPSLIFYETDQISPRGFELTDSADVTLEQREIAAKVCNNLQKKVAGNGRDVALQISLPYLLDNEALDPNIVLNSLKEHEHLPDFAFLVTAFLHYSHAQKDGKINASAELEKYLLSWVAKFLNSSKSYEFAHGLQWVWRLEEKGKAPGFNTLLKSPEFLKKLKEVGEKYPGFMINLVYDNEESFGNFSTFSSNIFDRYTKYRYFCEKIAEYDIDEYDIETPISFSAELLKNSGIIGFSEGDQTKLLNFCNKYASENELARLETIGIQKYSEHYLDSQDKNMNWYTQRLSALYSTTDNAGYELYTTGEFTPRNFVVKIFAESIMHNHELGYFDNGFLKKALISKEFLANPLMLIDYAMEVDRALDYEKLFTAWAASYLKQNFPFFIPENFENEGLKCKERLHDLTSMKPMASSQTNKFFNNINVDISLDQVLDLNLKDRRVSMSVTTLEDATDLRALSSQYDVFCQETLKDQIGNPIAATALIGYENQNNEISYDFRSTTRAPEILLSNFFIKDYRIGKEIRSNLEFSFDTSDLKLERYPFINGKISLPVDIIVGDQAVRYVKLGVKDEFNTNVAGLNVSFDKVEMSERENYADALEANIFLSVKNNYFIQLLKIVFPILVLASVALTTLPRQKATSDEAQLSLASAVMLSVIAYQFVVNALLPELQFLTALDYFIYALFLSAAFCVVSNVILHIEYFDSHAKKEQLLVSITNVSAISFYTIGIVLLINAWYQSMYS